MRDEERRGAVSGYYHGTLRSQQYWELYLPIEVASLLNICKLIAEFHRLARNAVMEKEEPVHLAAGC